jgi:hypothetical protein
MPDIWIIFSRRMRGAGHVALMGGRTGALKVFRERSGEKRQIGRGKGILVDNTKMDL